MSTHLRRPLTAAFLAALLAAFLTLPTRGHAQLRDIESTPDPAPAPACDPLPGTSWEELLSRVGVHLGAIRTSLLPSPARREGAELVNSSAHFEPLSVIGRTEHAAVYDPVRRRMIVVTGQGIQGYLEDTQALSLAGPLRWSPLHAGVAADLSRTDATAIYDSEHDRLILFGGFVLVPACGPPGYECLALNDLWVLGLSPGSRWTALRAEGSYPSERYLHSAIYDPVRRRMLVFGGTHLDRLSVYCSQTEPLADLWELSLGETPTWRSLSVSGDIPTAGLSGCGFYDPLRDRMIFTAGAQVWALDLESYAWAAIHPAGVGPSGQTRAVYDPGRDRLLVQAGPRTWAMPLSGPPRWEEIVVPAPRPEAGWGYSLTWDPEGDRMLLFGGGTAPDCSGSPRSETWVLSFAGGPRWELQSALVQPALALHAMVYDSQRDRMLSVGGIWTPGVYEFPLDSATGWSAVATAGKGPGAVVGHSAVYDPVRDRVLVYGGSELGSQTPLGDLWVLRLTGTPTWGRLSWTCEVGPSRRYATMVYDPPRDRLLVFGGEDDFNEIHNDVMALALSGDACWEPLETEGTPPSPRVFHGAVYDPIRDRMLVFGGGDQTGLRGDLWALDLAGTPRWSRVNDDGPRQELSTLVYDPVRDQLVVSCGDYDTAQVWGCLLSQGSAWYYLDQYCCGRDDFTPGRRIVHASIYDPVRDAVVTSGGIGRGWQSCYQLRDVWALVWGTPVLDVSIDIRPGNPENPVNLRSHGVLPVAILSRGRFDAMTVDPLSVRLAGAAVRLKGNGKPMAAAADVDGDGRADLVLHVEISELQLAEGDSIARLTGKAPGNLTVRGWDRVRIVPGCGGPAEQGGGQVAGETHIEPALLAVEALPSRGGVRVTLALGRGTPASLELMDLAGRRLARLVLEQDPSVRTVELGGGLEVASGVYWVRLKQSGAVLARRVVLIK
jgi:hypothetical protein